MTNPPGKKQTTKRIPERNAEQAHGHMETGKARDLMIRRLVDMALLPREQVGPGLQDLLDVMLVRLLVQMDIPLKRHMAERIAQMQRPLPLLSEKLTREVPPVAEPLLVNGENVDDNFLIAAAAISPDHRLFVASREYVSAPVVEAIVAYGEAEATWLLLSNREACFSGTALSRVVAQAGNCESWHRALVRRRELSTWQASMLFWHVAPWLRYELTLDFSSDRSRIREVVEELMPAVAPREDISDMRWKNLFYLAAPRPVPAPALVLAAAKKLSALDPYPAISALGSGALVHPETVFRIFEDKSGEALAVFARALQFSFEDFCSLYALAAPLHRESPSTVSPEPSAALYDFYHALSIDGASTFLQMWDLAIAGHTGIAKKTEAGYDRTQEPPVSPTRFH